MKDVNLKGFLSILHSVQVIENGTPVTKDAERQLYLDFHTERYFKTFNFLKPHLRAEGSSVLDIGLNPYFTTALLHLTNARFTGVWGGHRLDNVPLEKSRKEVHTRLNDRDFSIPIVDGYDLESDTLPFEDNSFDAVLLLEVIEHFIMNPVFALKELGRVLRPDGVLIVTTDNSHSLIKLMKFFALRPIYWPYNDQMFGDRHNREYMAKEIADFLTGIGFQNVRVELKNLSPYAFGKYPLKKKVGYEISNILTTLPYLTNFKRTIFAIARKGELKDYFPGWLFMRREGWIEKLIS